MGKNKKTRAYKGRVLAAELPVGKLLPWGRRAGSPCLQEENMAALAFHEPCRGSCYQHRVSSVRVAARERWTRSLLAGFGGSLLYVCGLGSCGKRWWQLDSGGHRTRVLDKVLYLLIHKIKARSCMDARLFTPEHGNLNHNVLRFKTVVFESSWSVLFTPGLSLLFFSFFPPVFFIRFFFFKKCLWTKFLLACLLWIGINIFTGCDFRVHAVNAGRPLWSTPVVVVQTPRAQQLSFFLHIFLAFPGD